MKNLLAITVLTASILWIYGSTTMIELPDSYATIALKQSQVSENATARPERQLSQQPTEAPEVTTVQPERQLSQQPSEGNTDRQNGLPFNTEQSNDEDQQEDEINGNIELKDEQFKGVEQEDENEDSNGDDENQIDARLSEADKKAPIAISGNNMYIVWFNDQNTPNNNSEVLFRASTDGGQTFGDKINLSNSTDADSTRVEIDSEADNVIVTWWETNQTSETPVTRISNDNGETFGPLLQLSTNGTIGQATEEE